MPTQCTCISPSPQRCSNPKSSVLCYTSYGVYRLTVRMHLVAQPRSSWSTIRRQRAQCVTPCAQSLTTSMAYPESAMPLFSAGEASPCICCSAQCTSAVHLRVPPASTDTGQGRPGGCCPDNMVTRNPGADSLLAWTRSQPSSSSGWNSGHQRVTSCDWLANPIHKHTHLISATSTGPNFLNNGEESLGDR